MRCSVLKRLRRLSRQACFLLFQPREVRMRLWPKGSGLVILVLSAALAGGCNRGPDPKDRVVKQLKDAHIDDVNVDYDRDTRVIHLKGAVDSAAEKTHAEQIAQQAVGTTGTIANELTVEGVNDRTADDMDNAIRKGLNAKVNNDRTREDRDINFDVNNGGVTVKGRVRTGAEKRQVAELTRLTADVKDVVNTLELDPKVGSATPKGTTGATEHPPASRPMHERDRQAEPAAPPARR